MIDPQRKRYNGFPMSTPNDLLRIAKRLEIPLTQREAIIVAQTVPKRGTPEWDYRERIRQRIGNGCISLGGLPHDYD